jgi:2,4-dienoyl-CoA reductase-like NADH-dependent reductase (Old Yellow Enzyme family)
MAAIWHAIRVGDLQLDHRLAMAPMTRDRSTTRALDDARPLDRRGHPRGDER